MRTNQSVFAVRALGLAVLLGIAGLATPPVTIAAPNTGSTPKTEKECKADLANCKTKCDKTMIDIDNNIQRCKDLCMDGYIICTPARSSGQPGGNLGGVSQPVRPGVLQPMQPTRKSSPYSQPGLNAPIMRRGVEEGQAAEPSPEAPTAPTPSSGTTK
ncbi:MAG: hypothetical protein E8D44_16930 [Nitrospira sp.]|nr:MAG: hypothetical protein E8D44_16930 [Nitrospira sp.]